MILSARELAGALRAARLFASQDETRAHLNCVHIEAHVEERGAALRLVATDGHTLWCCDVPARVTDADPAPADGTPWNASLADVDLMIRTAKGSAGGGRGDVVDLVAPSRSFEEVAFAQRSERFSPYQGVLPAVLPKGPFGAPPDLDPDYVARCCEAFRLYGAGFVLPALAHGTKAQKRERAAEREKYRTSAITWRSTGGEYDPVLFYSPAFPAAFAIVMPRRSIGGGSVADYLERVRRSVA